MRGNESVYLFRLTITLHSTQVMDRNDVLAFTKKVMILTFLIHSLSFEKI